MAFGLIPARGNWEYRWFNTASAATFAKGSLVNLGDEYELEEYASTDSQVLGIAMSYSTQSTVGNWSGSGNTNGVMVAIPQPGCTAMSDLTTSVTQSSLSIGKQALIYKQGNRMSFCSTVIGEASRFSAIVTVVGPIQADTSQVEVAFNILSSVFYSTSSATFAT